MRPMAPAPRITVTPPGFNPFTTPRGPSGFVLGQMDVVILRRDDAGEGLAQCRMGIRQGGVGKRKQAAGGKNLLADQDVFRQMPAQSVAHRHLVDSARVVTVALAMVDGRAIHGGLDDVPLPGAVARAQVRRPPRPG